ncbi:MAG TPA: hypothetical protein VGE36_10835 [Roseateles sp.]
MNRTLAMALTLSALLNCHAATAQDLVGDVKACRLKVDATSRLGCYDAMKLPGGEAVAAAKPAAPAAEAVAKFGQEAIKPPAGAPPALKQVESRIRGKFQGWGPNKRIELENGQVWRIADDSEALYELQDPKVIVHRGLFGAYFLEIEGVPFQVRVVRAR